MGGEFIERGAGIKKVGRNAGAAAAGNTAVSTPFDRIYEGCVGTHTVTDVGPSRDRTAAVKHL